ncbi:MAG: sulfatase-like hydrolase/transferase [Planctomycetota bacterium]
MLAMNVVIFLTDQQRWDTIGALGCPLELTPNFDHYAQRGTLFPYATTPQPVCGPARACLQTGRYATAVGDDGCHTNGRPLPVDHDTLAKRFRDAGHATGYFGKWHLGGSPPGGSEAVAPDQHGGWETYLSANALEACSDGYRTALFDPDGRVHHPPGYRVDAVTDAGIRFLHDAASHDRPFCCMISHLEPHMQNHRDAHPAPAGYEARYRGRWTPPDLLALPGQAGTYYQDVLGGNAQQALPGYLGSIKRLDEAFGRVMDTLISLGRLDDTVVVFTTDHGCHFRTRNDEYKRSVHDVSVRIPFMVHGGPFIGGGRDERPIQLTDLAPTLCDAAGFEPPAGAQGRSALGDLPDEAFIQVSESGFSRAVRTDRWKYAASADPDGVSPFDRHADRLVESHLYDLVADPYELVNLVGLEPYAAVRSGLKERLRRRMAEAGEPPCVIDDAPPPDLPVGQLAQRKVEPGDDRAPLTA